MYFAFLDRFFEFRAGSHHVSEMKITRYAGRFQPPYPLGKTKYGGTAAKFTMISGIARRRMPPRL